MNVTFHERAIGREGMPFQRHRHPAWLLAVMTILCLAFFIMGRNAIVADAEIFGVFARHYEIPPAFGESRMLYGSVLALMMTMSVLALGAVIENIRFLCTHPSLMREPVKVSVTNETILLVSVLLSIVPDVLVLLAWGELMAPSGAELSKLDRVFDGVSAIVFFGWVFRRLRSRPVLLFSLQQRGHIPVDLEPNWQQLRPKFLIVGAITLISFGVAFGK